MQQEDFINTDVSVKALEMLLVIHMFCGPKYGRDFFLKYFAK